VSVSSQEPRRPPRGGGHALCALIALLGLGCDGLAPATPESDGAACEGAPRVACCEGGVCAVDPCDAAAPPVLVATCPGGCEEGRCLACEAACGDRACGPDGCGGSCGDCVGGEACVDGLCACLPTLELGCCDGALCPIDSCGQVGDAVAGCPHGCEAGACVGCVPACDDRDCGADGCGGSCGECVEGLRCVVGRCACVGDERSGCCPDELAVCRLDSCGQPEAVLVRCEGPCEAGRCVGCDPACGDRECGPDGCGGSCGGCSGGAVCADGRCLCAPTDAARCCGDAVCAVDTCGGSGAVIAGCPGGCVDGVCHGCEAACDGRGCGPDGCGGSCGGCLGEGEVCVDGACTCAPRVGVVCCGSALCWVDSCGGLGEALSGCPLGCEAGACVPCEPDCDGRVCGSDGCGGACGDPCEGDERCVDGRCVCGAPEVEALVCCDDAVCALDGCGAVLGEVLACPFGCEDGACAPCAPDCAGRSCGPDGCGGVCGACQWGAECDAAGACACLPEVAESCCGAAVCWVDSCGALGEVIATCPYGCAAGECLPCEPACGGRDCGPDGCGGHCGSCEPDEACTASGHCIPCTLDCAGRSCGPDGCGDHCGLCESPAACVDGACLVTVRGRFSREMRRPNASLTGLLAPEVVPVVGLPVALSAGGELLGEAVTDATGAFTLAVAHVPEGELQATLAASLAGPDGLPWLAVLDSAQVGFPTQQGQPVTSQRVWAWTASAPPGALDLGDLVVTEAAGAGALALLLAFSDALAATLGVATYQGLEVFDLPTLGVLWHPLATPPCLSCFFPAGWGPLRLASGGELIVFGRFIWLSGSTYAPHHWTPSMSLHELGHYVMDVLSRSPNEGGPHSWDGLIKPGLAWSEGFATFYGQWALSREAEQPRFYSSQGGTHYWIDIERVGSELHHQASSFGGVTFPLPRPDEPLTQFMNEAVVAAILWDLWDVGGLVPEPDAVILGDVLYDFLSHPRVLDPDLDRAYPTMDLVDLLDAIRCDDALTMEELSTVLMGFPYDDAPTCP